MKEKTPNNRYNRSIVTKSVWVAMTLVEKAKYYEVLAEKAERAGRWRSAKVWRELSIRTRSLAWTEMPAPQMRRDKGASGHRVD